MRLDLLFLSVLIASSLAHAGETNAPSAVWYLKQLAYDVEEQWVNVDYQGGPEHEVRDSRIQIRSGDGLKKDKKVEGGSLPGWSASGQKIAFLGFCNGYVGCSQISVASSDGSNRKVITSSRDGVSDFS